MRKWLVFSFFSFFLNWLSKRQKGQSEWEHAVKSHPEALTDRTQIHQNTSEQSNTFLCSTSRTGLFDAETSLTSVSTSCSTGAWLTCLFGHFISSSHSTVLVSLKKVFPPPIVAALSRSCCLLSGVDCSYSAKTLVPEPSKSLRLPPTWWIWEQWGCECSPWGPAALRQ